jgi:C4-dicarboxylate-specific signal transduction histidine kinase
MRLPRMTTRRWMVATAVIAVLCWGELRIHAFQQRAAFHAREKQSCPQEAQQAERAYSQLQELASQRYLCGPKILWLKISEDFEKAPELRERAEYHAELESLYRQAMYRPWALIPREGEFSLDSRAHPTAWFLAKAARFKDLESERRELAARAKEFGRTK